MLDVAAQITGHISLVLENTMIHVHDIQGPVHLGKAVAAQLLRMEIEAPADLPRLKRK
jgi:hypothetical protein